MTTTLTSKLPGEQFFITFDFADVLGAETVGAASVVATDQADDSVVTASVTDVAKQTNTDTVVYVWVQDGTTGHTYRITCTITGSLDSIYILEALLPVGEDAGEAAAGTRCVLEPTLEPITLAELKLHLRLDSETLAGNLTTSQSILPGSHGVSAGGAYTHSGAAVEVIGKTAIVNLNAGTVGAGGTVDAKIQESDDNSVWTDWTGGAFTQVTAVNDNAVQEKAYTGSKRYIRVVAKVLVAACEFGADVIVNAATTAEDDLLTALITAAREHVEDHTRRKLLTQTWDWTFPAWPRGDSIKLPFGNLQSVSSVKWKDTDGVETTLAETTDYLVEPNGAQCGKIVLPYGGTWPSGTLYPSNPITVRFICGWDAAASIPSKIRAAVKMIAAKLYESRGEDTVGQTVHEDKTVLALLASHRLWDNF